MTTVAVRSVDESSDAGAEAVFDLSLTLEPDGSPPMDFRIRCNAQIRNEQGRWKIVNLLERGG